jgi:hypothetical protein
LRIAAELAAIGGASGEAIRGLKPAQLLAHSLLGVFVSLPTTGNF